MIRFDHALLLALAASGCNSQVAGPPLGPHPPEAAVVVPYPPPPAKLQELPPQPRDECVWTDGYWEFTDRWEWQPGEWVVPQPGCYFTPMDLKRQGGKLWYARPRWYKAGERPVTCQRPPVCRAATPE